MQVGHWSYPGLAVHLLTDPLFNPTVSQEKEVDGNLGVSTGVLVVGYMFPIQENPVRVQRWVQDLGSSGGV